MRKVCFNKSCSLWHGNQPICGKHSRREPKKCFLWPPSSPVSHLPHLPPIDQKSQPEARWQERFLQVSLPSTEQNKRSIATGSARKMQPPISREGNEKQEGKKRLKVLGMNDSSEGRGFLVSGLLLFQLPNRRQPRSEVSRHVYFQHLQVS